MSENTDTTGASQANGEIRIERVYLKDASFESPSTPDIFLEEWKPEVQVDINTRADRVGPEADGRFEVVLTTTVRAKRPNGKTAFIVEAQQAGLFVLLGLPGNVQQQALGTICPATLFPYLREGLDNLVVKGGFPALLLAPVNFEALYADAVAKRAAQQPSSEAAGNDGNIKH